MPAKKALGPLSFNICFSNGTTAVFSFANIILVFSTSNGVVVPAAIAPAALPNSPLSHALAVAVIFSCGDLPGRSGRLRVVPASVV